MVLSKKKNLGSLNTALVLAVMHFIQPSPLHLGCCCCHPARGMRVGTGICHLWEVGKRFAGGGGWKSGSNPPAPPPPLLCLLGFVTPTETEGRNGIERNLD